MTMESKSRLGSARVPPAGTPILDVRDLRTQFFTDAGIVRAVDGVTFSVAAGETLGIVGESGSGKSVTALSLMRLLDEPSRIVGGEVRFQGRDVLAMNADELRALRGDGIAMVFQDPMTSLNPVLRIARQLVETMRAHGRFDEEEATTRAVSLLGRMGITAPERAINSYPHQFSGGMRQRVVLALALAAEPELVIADEPTTALDVSVQAQIIALLKRLCRQHGAAVMLITHDMGVIAETADRVAVMYAGRIAEIGPVRDVVKHPHHPYTKGLMGAIPTVGAQAGRLVQIPGSMPRLAAIPKGCAFHPRCPYAFDRCRIERPDGLQAGNSRVACWLVAANTAEAPA